MRAFTGYGVVAIDIGDGIGIGALFLDGHSYQDLTVGIDDSSRNFQRPCGKGRNAEKQGQQQAGPLYCMLDCCNSHY